MKKRIFVSSYFAGAFMGEGFNNYLPEAIEGMKKIYIIKGTPGSGKSTLMKKIAFAAEAAGEKVERIYCSSDTTSLDGIVIPSISFAMVDGTAPHVLDASYPKAVETIINTGDFIVSSPIENRRDEIISISNAKKKLFSKAEFLLHAASSLRRLKTQLLEEGYLAEKGFKFCKDILEKEKTQKSEGSVIKRSVASFSKNGITLLNAFTDAEKIYSINEEFSQFILGTLKLLAEEYNISAIYSPSPLCSTDVACVYLTESKRLFISSALRDDGVKISAHRFESGEALNRSREKRKFLSKTESIILKEAQGYLSEAMEKHKALEEIYVSALNKDGLDCLASSIAISLFGDK